VGGWLEDAHTGEHLGGWLEDAHTGEHLGGVYKIMFEGWGISEEQVYLVLRDSG